MSELDYVLSSLILFLFMRNHFHNLSYRTHWKTEVNQKTSPQPEKYYLPSLYLMPIVGICAEKFIDLKRILMNAGLSPTVLQSPNNQIDYLTFIKVLNEGTKVSGDELFGFLVGKCLSVTNVGALGSLIAAQTCIANIYPVITYLFNNENRGARHELEIVGKTAYHKINYLVEEQINCDQIAQLTLMGYFNVFKQSLGDIWQPTRILLKSTSLKDTSRIAAYCGCPVVTGCDKNAIEFPEKIIYQEIEKHDFDSREAKMELASILNHCEDLQGLIASFIEFSLAGGRFEKPHIAKRLGIHPRVFQHCLHSKGLEYKQILRDVRERKARYLLETTSVSITNIATQLGYQDTRSFTRAFKGWMKITPLKYRKQQTGMPR